ncbi:MAG: hypothetical protein AMXMBFR48_00670 [Ignavibacteriales bacterium]
MDRNLPHYFLQCSTCNTQNELFRLNCSKCGSVLDNRYPNLDLWTTIARLIDSPTIAFKGIIRAEHKNFVVFLLLFLAVRFISYGEFWSAFVIGNSIPLLHGLFVIPLYLAAVFAVYLILKKLLSRSQSEVRYTDVLAGSVYSALPIYFSGTFLFLLEYIFFGKYMFMSNPNAFMINDIIAWMFVGMETLLFLYYLILLNTFFRIFLKNIIITGLLSLFLAGLTIFLYTLTLSFYG